MYVSKQEGNGPIDQHATGLKVYRAGLKGGLILLSNSNRPLEVSRSTYEPPNKNLTKVFRDANPASLVQWFIGAQHLRCNFAGSCRMNSR